MKKVIKGTIATISALFLALIFTVAPANAANAATMTFHKFNTCYQYKYGYVETWSYTDYSWGEEFWLGKRDTWTFIRRDRATWLDTSCRTWYA